MTRLLDTADRRPVHFIGAGGAGMRALAELFVRRGIAVSGCDASVDGDHDLAALGVTVLHGHSPAHIDGVRAVVYSSAIDADSAELARARAAGIPVIRRAEALGEAVRGGQLVGVAGTHGKTTTTVMTTEALAAAGKNPTGIAGGRVSAWNGNLRRGGEGVFVVEADEYDRSFLALRPDVAVVTNIEADHLDIYQDIDEIRKAFAQFIGPAKFLVSCADDAGVASLRVPPTMERVGYGVRGAGDGVGNARLVARDVRFEGGITLFSVWFDGEHAGDMSLQVPGEHNIRNALAALGCGLVWGVSVESMAPGLAAFAGVERRFQRLGDLAGVSVVDDYAHHPTEIRATLAAARAAFPGRRIVVAFQPHLFTRTRDFAGEFGAALALADVLLVTEIYAAREDPIDGVTSSLVVDAARRAGAAVVWRGDRGELTDALVDAVRSGDVVLTVGAGDITLVGPDLLERLGAAPHRIV